MYYGTGLVKGLMVTLRHFIETYVDDFRYGLRKYSKRVDNFDVRQGPKAKGAFTVQYPDEKLAVPERFRFVPFLIVNEDDHPLYPGRDWCTSCGICAKVCPPQCIWIVRGNDPDTGRPIPEPEAFFIDIDICMNCGYCAEYCPFDAIKMDHDYELASYDRTTAHIHDKERLSKPNSYWKSIAPTRAHEEMLARGSWEHKNWKDEVEKARQSGESDSRREKVRERKAQQEERQAEASTEPAAEAKQEAAATPDKDLGLGDEEARRKRREEALKRKALRAKRETRGE